MAELTYPIDKLAVDRPVRVGPAELFDQLKQSIELTGIIRPLIIHPDTGIVVDGVRRLEAAKQLGLTEVPVFEAFDRSEVIDEMTLTVRHGLAAWQADHYRVWYLRIALTPYTREERRRSIMRGIETRRGGRPKEPRRMNVERDSIAAALGRPVNYIQQALALMTRVFDPSHREHVEAMQLLEMVDDGICRIGGAREQLDRLIARRRQGRDVPVDVAQQKLVLSNAVTSITAIAQALDSLGQFRDGLEDRVIGDLEQELHELSRVIHGIKTQLRKSRGV